MQKEIWKDIPNYEGYYQVSDLGNVKGIERYVKHNLGGLKIIKENIIKQNKNTQGYLFVNLSKKGLKKSFTIHQLVVMAFLNHKPDGTQILVVDHINNNKLDNTLKNLQIITNRENISKDRKNGTSKYTGVSWNKIECKWEVSININKKKYYLGKFNDEIKASEAYKLKLSKTEKIIEQIKNKLA